MNSTIQQRQITVDEYYQMGAHGIIGPEERTQLINGQILNMSPVGSEHAAIVDKTNQLLQMHVAATAIVRIQNPLRLSTVSESEPDILVVRPQNDFYRSEHPGPEDVLLLIEVAKESLRFDLTLKKELYARAGIPQYVVVDIANLRMIDHRKPNQDSGQYDSVVEMNPEELVTFDQIGMTVKVESLL